MRERSLSRTFRFARGIEEPSTAFVVRNPAQTQRTLRPADGVRDEGVTVIASDDAARGLQTALQDIEEHEGSDGPPISVLVLGRYRGSRGALPRPRRGRLRVEFSTVHAAKGREADYVVVLDLRDARRGFPSQHEDDPLLGLVLPPPPEGSYPHAEERRVFYVALTRARRGTYLIADQLRPSAFVDELLRTSSGLRRLGEFRRDSTPPCPRCRTGRLDLSGRRPQHELPELPLLPLPRAALPELPEGLRGDLGRLLALHERLVRRAPAGLRVVRRGGAGHPQGAHGLVPRVYAVRLGPAVHEYAEPRGHPPPLRPPPALRPPAFAFNRNRNPRGATLPP